MRRFILAAAILIPVASAPIGCKLASRNRVNAINRMNKGIELYKKNNTSGAIEALQDAVQEDPSFDRPHATLGQIFRKQGKLVDAQKEFEAAITASATEPNADYHYQLGTVVAAQGEAEGVSHTDMQAKFNSAIGAFQEAIKIKPTHYMAYFRMGTLQEKLDQPNPADQSYRKAIELRPNFSPSFVSLGNMYIDYGHANVGESVLQAGVQINDTDAKMWNGLGRAYLSLNRAQEAIDAFQKAKAIDPDMPDVLFGLGMAYADLRMRNEAVENLNAFLQKAGTDVPEDRKKAANDTVARMQDVI